MGICDWMSCVQRQDMSRLILILLFIYFYLHFCTFTSNFQQILDPLYPTPFLLFYKLLIYIINQQPIHSIYLINWKTMLYSTFLQAFDYQHIILYSNTFIPITNMHIAVYSLFPFFQVRQSFFFPAGCHWYPLQPMDDDAAHALGKSPKL